MIHIIHFIKRKSLFLLGFIFVGILNILGSFFNHSNRNDSLFIDSASADIASWVGTDAGGAGGASCGGCSSGAGCFKEGTIISAPLGSKEIQLVSSGDIVYGFDAESGEIGEFSVLKTMKHSWDEVGNLYPILEVMHERGVLFVTSNHQFYKKDSLFGKFKDFDEIGNFKKGDFLILEDGKKSIIFDIKNADRYNFVYNFEVEKVHTYIAGGVRVHNDK